MKNAKKLDKTIVLLIACGALSACAVDARLLDLSASTEAPDSAEKTQRTEADFVAGEVVTTTHGVLIRGTFGEISEQKTLSNGVVIEGIFYE